MTGFLDFSLPNHSHCILIGYIPGMPSSSLGRVFDQIRGVSPKELAAVSMPAVIALANFTYGVIKRLYSIRLTLNLKRAVSPRGEARRWKLTIVVLIA